MINRGKYKQYQPVAHIVRVIYRLGLSNEGNKQAGVVLRSILVNNREIVCILVNNRDFFPLTVLTG